MAGMDGSGIVRQPDPAPFPFADPNRGSGLAGAQKA